MTRQPATAAGQALLEDNGPHVVTGEHDMLTRILAIEAEVRDEALAQQDDAIRHGYEQGKREAEAAALDVEALARALALLAALVLGEGEGIVHLNACDCRNHQKARAFLATHAAPEQKTVRVWGEDGRGVANGGNKP